MLSLGKPWRYLRIVLFCKFYMSLKLFQIKNILKGVLGGFNMFYKCKEKDVFTYLKLTPKAWRQINPSQHFSFTTYKLCSLGVSFHLWASSSSHVSLHRNNDMQCTHYPWDAAYESICNFCNRNESHNNLSLPQPTQLQFVFMSYCGAWFHSSRSDKLLLKIQVPLMPRSSRFLT